MTDYQDRLTRLQAKATKQATAAPVVNEQARAEARTILAQSRARMGSPDVATLQQQVKFLREYTGLESDDDLAAEMQTATEDNAQ